MPTFQTARLILREVEMADLDQVHHLHSMPESDEFNTMGIPDSIEVTKSLLKEWESEKKRKPRKTYVFSIELAENREFIGLIALVLGKPNYRNADVWYKIDVKHWRRSYATEALMEVLNFAFYELHLHRVEAGCAVENIGSMRVLEKVGMMREGLKRKNLPIRGEWVDNYEYAILEEEFGKKPLQSDYAIRPYEISDREKLISIFKLNVPEYFDPKETDYFIEYLDQKPGTYLTIEFENEIVGGVGYEVMENDKSGRINWIFVHPDFSGEGLGKKAVEYCLKILKSNPLVEILIVRTSQLAYRFFEKLGYKVIKIEKEYWGKGLDLYLMEQAVESK